MNLNRRRYLALGAAGLLGHSKILMADSVDGVGPNRGISERSFRGKQTCTNSDVIKSDMTTRISTPDDFGTSACHMIKDSYEGPYFTCSPSTGKDIAIAQAGQSLIIAMRVVDGNCNAIPNAVVDIWACNADGYYAGYSNDPKERPPIIRAILFGHFEPDTEERFCRGALRTDANGIAEFNTVYPGFYYGQPIHVHFKVHVDGKSLLTSQANFSEHWNERIVSTSPYDKPRSIKRNSNKTDFPEMRIVERGDHLVAVLDLVLPS